MRILGISGLYHDSAVAAVENGQIRFAIQEERLSRQKHDSRFPVMGISKALEVCQWDLNDVDEVVFYEKPSLKLNRLLDQVVDGWPQSWNLFRHRIPRFYRHKYPIRHIMRDRYLYQGPVEFCEHHQSHAAAAFFTSPFEKALVLTIDGVGEYETTSVYQGEGNQLRKVASIHFPDSLGLLYSVFTQYLGFRVNNGEYKVMGLAPYGEPRFLDKILGTILILDEDGSFHLNQKYFDFLSEERHYSQRLISHLGLGPRKTDESIEQSHKDLAASIQKALEIAIENMLSALLKAYPSKNVCLGGGVALNCTANARIIRNLGVNLHIHPAAGDAGGALGAALSRAMTYMDSKETYRFPFSPYLGIEYPSQLVDMTLKLNQIEYSKSEDPCQEIAERLAAGQIVAVCQGRDEWGPRALGNRSILADPRQAGMKDHLNAKIKFREGFRPFAPVVMQEHYSRFFEMLGMEESPHMLFTHKAMQPQNIAATVHVNETSRAQTVTSDQNPFLYRILEEFYAITSVPVLINTSFNLKGEPIVSSPSDALKTFFASGIDVLSFGEYIVKKPETSDECVGQSTSVEQCTV